MLHGNIKEVLTMAQMHAISLTALALARQPQLNFYWR